MKKLLIIASIFIGATGCGGENKTETTESADTTTSAAAMETMDATSMDTASATASVTAPPMDSAAMMKKWQEFMTPGEAHKLLASQVGTWKEEMTMWMAPGAPPTKNTMTATIKMAFNGLYQQAVHKGNFEGQSFEGHSTVGYDNAKKKYVSTWYDNMGSGIMYMEGDYDPGTKTITLRGNCVDPMTGKPMDMRETMTMIDDKTWMMEMYDNKTGKEEKSMEIKMTKM